MSLLDGLKNFLFPRAYAFERIERPPAVVLAAFGTTHPEALTALENVEARVRAAFPDYETRLAFTSNQVRARWRARGADPGYRKKWPKVHPRYYEINNVLSELASLQEAGGRPILVQSVLVADGEEFRDLFNLIEGLKNLATRQRSLHPFPWIGLGPPALGLGHGDEAALARAARALSPVGERAASGEATVALMAHGHERLELKVFKALEAVAKGLYGPNFHIGLVEGQPDFSRIKAAVEATAPPGGRLLLAPLMVVAGDHAKNDLAGEEGGWASEFKRMGYNVEVSLAGLGSNDQWADLYVESLRRVKEEVFKAKAEEDGLSVA
ncbi:MAG: sirohydrochlorin cobaltochelatase [Deltaproteobacteria bacterium]|jgi:sirohydrochlorin cobaltochelatase|nr:sirohydrochlorin cobaltochelatase [Deltaproteobacteria bacterium]